MSDLQRSGCGDAPESVSGRGKGGRTMSDPRKEKNHPLFWQETAYDLLIDPPMEKADRVLLLAEMLAAAYRDGTEFRPLLELKRHPAQVPAPVYPGQPFPEPGQVIVAVESQVEVLQKRIDRLEAVLQSVLDSAIPHPVEHPTMTQALAAAREALWKCRHCGSRPEGVWPWFASRSGGNGVHSWHHHYCSEECAANADRYRSEQGEL